MKPKYRARIIELARSTGIKGIPAVVADALHLYLENHSGRLVAIRGPLALKGSMKETAAARQLMRARTGDDDIPSFPIVLLVQLAGGG